MPFREINWDTSIISHWASFLSSGHNFEQRKRESLSGIYRVKEHPLFFFFWVYSEDIERSPRKKKILFVNVKCTKFSTRFIYTLVNKRRSKHCAVLKSESWNSNCDYSPKVRSPSVVKKKPCSCLSQLFPLRHLDSFFLILLYPFVLFLYTAFCTKIFSFRKRIYGSIEGGRSSNRSCLFFAVCLHNNVFISPCLHKKKTQTS